MPAKHYDIQYLENTFNIMEDIKRYSHSYFQNIKEGTVLDLGCGTGKDVTLMASLSPKTEFIGIDHDIKMIEQANAQKNNLSNVSFFQKEVFPLPFDNNSIAGIRAERLFQHLMQPLQLLEEIHRVLLPGYPFVIVETDWDSISFYNTDATSDQKLRTYLTEKKVPQGKIAKQLTLLLTKHQFRKIKLDIFPVVLHSFQDACTYLWIDKIAREMRQKNIFSTTEYTLFMDSLKKADSEKYFACSINIATAFCIK